jgi:hypothetical protein
MTRGQIGLAILGLLILMGGARIWLSFRSQPQLPPSDEVFKTVDGLFTAITARDERRLAACEERLQCYHQSAELPDASWKRLNGFINMARSGEWEAAARRLYDFMHGQRRADVPRPRGSRLAAGGYE